MTEWTKYITMKRCLNCWHVNDSSLNKCTQCNMLFRSEATEAEKQTANDKVEDLKIKVADRLK